MRALPHRESLLSGGIVLCCVALAGCGVKPGTDTAPQTASQAAPPQTPEQRLQEQARVIKIIKEMTPEQRAAHFKAHPEDVAALAP